MHFAFLPALLLAFAGGLFGGSSAPIAQHTGARLYAHSLYTIAAQATVTDTNALTATNSLTATAITTGTAVSSTPVPLPTAAAQGSIRGNPLDWDYLTQSARPAMGPFAWVFLALMLALFGVSAYFYFYKRPEWKRTNSVLRRATERWAPYGLWIGGLGLFFLVLRVIQLDFFDKRIWLYLWLLAAIVVIVWFYLWYRNTLPEQLARYEKVQRAKQYMPASAKKGSRPATPGTRTVKGAGGATGAGSAGTGGQPASSQVVKVVPTSVTGAAQATDKKRRRKR